MQPQIAPSGDLEIKCSFKALPHQRNFSDLEAMSMFMLPLLLSYYVKIYPKSLAC